jgi:RNA polymerase sigma-70 factor, ECF subfamily
MTEHDELVVQLIGSCQRRLYLYLSGLLCAQDSADDVLQETNVVLWQKRSQYAPGTNFFAWACRIAYFEACKARQRRKKKVPSFSDVFLDGVAPELLAASEIAEPLQLALLECVDELNQRDRELLERRYAEEATTQSVAASVGRSTDSVYKSLGRIHQKLFDCILRKMNEDDRP